MKLLGGSRRKRRGDGRGGSITNAAEIHKTILVKSSILSILFVLEPKAHCSGMYQVPPLLRALVSFVFHLSSSSIFVKCVLL